MFILYKVPPVAEVALSNAYGDQTGKLHEWSQQVENVTTRT